MPEDRETDWDLRDAKKTLNAEPAYQKWIEQTIGEKLPETGSLKEALRDGTVLTKLINCIARDTIIEPKMMHPVTKDTNAHYLIENVNMCLR